MQTVAKVLAPVKRYATFKPDMRSEHTLYGEATLMPSAHGWLFQQDGCDWNLSVRYSDVRLTVGQLVGADGVQLPLFAVA